MGAREKLNNLCISISLVIAALIGLAVESWAASLATSIVLIGMGYLGGAIRPARRCR